MRPTGCPLKNRKWCDATLYTVLEAKRDIVPFELYLLQLKSNRTQHVSLVRVWKRTLFSGISPILFQNFNFRMVGVNSLSGPKEF